MGAFSILVALLSKSHTRPLTRAVRKSYANIFVMIGMWYQAGLLMKRGKNRRRFSGKQLLTSWSPFNLAV